MTIEEWRGLLDAIDHGAAAGAPSVVATLFDRAGHSYRDPGAMMAMTETLQIIGGVAGGCVEEYVGRSGRELLKTTEAALITLDADDETPGRPAPGCGGTLHVVVERGGENVRAYLSAVIRAVETSDRAVTVIRVSDGETPRTDRFVIVNDQVIFQAKTPAGQTMQQADDEALHGVALRLAARAVATRGVVTEHADNVTITASYLWPQPRLVVFGARDDAAPLVRIAKAAGWHVTIADRRLRLATTARFADADVVLDTTWARCVAAIPWTPWTAVVAMTHSFDDDLELLPLLAGMSIEYLGFLGPAVRTKRLLAACPKIDPARVRSPVGLPLGDKSAGGIAVAIMAELTIVFRRRPNDKVDVNGRRHEPTAPPW